LIHIFHISFDVADVICSLLVNISFIVLHMCAINT